MIYVLHALLAVAAFLLALNSFLRGTLKAYINIFLGLFLIGILISCFIVFGWKAGLLAIVLTVLYGAVSRPLAARVVAKLFALPGDTSAHYIGLPPSTLERISHALSPPANFHAGDLVSGSEQFQKAEEVLFDYCQNNAGVREIMEEFKASRTTLRELYYQIVMTGAGQWRGGHYVAASAIAYPHTLRFLLKHCAKGTVPPEIAWKLLMHFESGAKLEEENRA